jgi:hypothetical protein
MLRLQAADPGESEKFVTRYTLRRAHHSSFAEILHAV